MTEDIEVDKLEPHPYNKEVLPDGDPTERFVGDIATHGIEEPLKIDSDNRILDGKQRWRAAKLLDEDTVPCERREYVEDGAEELAILALNDHRDETFTQKVKTALEYEERVAPYFDERMKAGKELDEVYDLEEEEEKDGAGGHHTLSILTEGSNQTEEQKKHDTRRAYAADRVGWSPTTLYYAKQIWKARTGDLDIDDEDALQRLQEIAENEVERLDQGEQKVYTGYQEIEMWKKRVANGYPVTWEECRDGGVHFTTFGVKEEYTSIRDKIEENVSWETAVETAQNHWESTGGDADLRTEITFAYLLEADEETSIADDGPTPQLDERKPDADTLHEVYLEEDRELSRLRTRFGVPTLLVAYWMMEEEVPLKFGDLEEKYQQRLATRSIVPESYEEGQYVSPDESKYLDGDRETAADGGERPSDSEWLD